MIHIWKDRHNLLLKQNTVLPSTKTLIPKSNWQFKPWKEITGNSLSKQKQVFSISPTTNISNYFKVISAPLASVAISFKMGWGILLCRLEECKPKSHQSSIPLQRLRAKRFRVSTTQQIVHLQVHPSSAALQVFLPMSLISTFSTLFWVPLTARVNSLLDSKYAMGRTAFYWISINWIQRIVCMC